MSILPINFLEMKVINVLVWNIELIFFILISLFLLRLFFRKNKKFYLYNLALDIIYVCLMIILYTIDESIDKINYWMGIYFLSFFFLLIFPAMFTGVRKFVLNNLKITIWNYFYFKEVIIIYIWPIIWISVYWIIFNYVLPFIL